ncbi:MAG: aldo/keto reductase, partial [Hyphomicrobiaceae bacterium]|nr:aldo/keto reductase [Hyphomicrobiaceae bacterium]
LVHGLLTGTMTPDRQFKEGDLRRGNPCFNIESRQQVAAMLNEFVPIAKKHKATISQLVIAWTFSRPGVTHVLCGARTQEQAVENAAAGDLVLDEEDIQAINGTIEQ